MKRSMTQELLFQPADVVMAAIMDVPPWTPWRPGLLDTKNLSDDPVVPGSAWTEERALTRRSLRLSARTVEVDPPRTFAYALEGDGIEASLRWQAATVPSDTMVSLEVRARPSSLRARLAGLAQDFAVQQSHSLSQLRQFVEANAAETTETHP